MAQEAGVEINVTTGAARDLMRRAGAGLVCSGTATLEAACLGLPYALVYKVATLTYEIGLRLIRVKHLGMVNILSDRQIVREFIQHEATPAALADEGLRLLNNRTAREQLAAELLAVTSTLGGEAGDPAPDRAARAVLDCLAMAAHAPQ
jgi:lipid-A-disaccharide synthase